MNLINFKINKDDDKTTTIKKYNKSDVIFTSNHSAYKYHDIEKFDNLSYKSKYSFFVKFFKGYFCHKTIFLQ